MIDSIQNTRSLHSRITRISLERFKGFERASAPFGNFTVLVGTNASGKSNLRDAFRFLHGISRGYSLAEIVGEKWIEGGVLQWRGLRGGPREVGFAGADSFAIEVGVAIGKDVDAVEYSYRIEVRKTATERLVVEHERLSVTYNGEILFCFDAGFLKNVQEQAMDPMHIVVEVEPCYSALDSNDPVFLLLADRACLAQIEVFSSQITPSFAQLLRDFQRALRSIRFFDFSPEAMRLPSTPGQPVLGDRGENLSSILQEVCTEPAKKAILIQWIRALAPLDVTDFSFSNDLTGKVLVYLVDGNGNKTSAHSSSDGTLRFLAMLAAFLGKNPACLCFFEEIETGLHPTRLHLLTQLIESQVQEGTFQVIATTHSPQLLAFLSPVAVDNALVAYRNVDKPGQHLQRVRDLPNATRVLQAQNLSDLYADGWLEDAIFFSKGQNEQ